MIAMECEAEAVRPALRDGDRLYVVFEAEDTLNAGSRLVNIYEYTWSEGPETVWIYNPPMAD